MFRAAGPKGEFLKLPETRQLFRSEQYLPSEVIDRNAPGAEEVGKPRDAFGRAWQRVAQLLGELPPAGRCPGAGSAAPCGV